MARFRPSRDLGSLRFRLPLFLMLYCLAVAVVLYIVADQVQERRFEQAFESTQLLRATEIQSRTERAAERNELETGQREFGELAVVEELRAAVFVSPENLVVLSSRREWSGRPLDLAALGLPPGEQTRVTAAMRQARQTGRVVSQFSADRNDLAIVMPAALPLGPGALRLDRRALILLLHDLSFAKSVNRFRLRQQFGVALLGVLIAVLGLGVTLHVLVTRRIEHLHGVMARFAAGKPVENEPVPSSQRADEISHLFRHFTGIAATMNREITIRRQAEYALQESEERFRSAMHHSPVGMALVATDARFLEVNPALCSIMGYTHDELLATTFKALTHPDDLTGDMAAIARMLNGDIDTYRTVKRYFHKDGRVVWGLLNSSLVRDEGGKARYFVAQVQDITESRRAEAEVVAMNERYARQEAALTTLMRRYASAPDDFTPIVRELTEVVAWTLEVAQVSVWRHDDRGTSTRCLDLFQWPDNQHSSGTELTEEACPAFFTSLASSDVIAAHDAQNDDRTIELVTDHLRPYGITSMMSVAIRSQGTTVGVLSCMHTRAPRRWTPDEQTFAIAIANFLSAITAQVERQRLEEQLRQAQKLEAIGQLAGGVAHDFNNILTVILGRAEEAAVDARLPGDLREAMADIFQNAERASALTRQLLTFSRRHTIQVRDVDMNAVVANLKRMLDRILGEDVVVEFRYASRPAFVRADPGLIEQVLLNLAVNARDAMPLGGQLSIETSVIEAPGEPGGPARRFGTWVCLEVTDSGSGISDEHLPRIFEPFFTTKDVGKGTGLGLATSYGIVQQHGGWIEVDSQIDRGTTFRVFFPHVASMAADVSTSASTASPSPRGDETILVVEDEEGVRALVIKVLEALGYRLLEAPSGPRAIDVWREHGPGIDMLITDIVMPDGMNGIQLAERLRRSSPSLKVIYTSGYLADVSRDDIPSRDTDAYLAKPFSLPELARLVRRTLDAREATGREEAR